MTSSQTPAQPRAQLYSFPGSVWASVPRIALVEKGYASNDVEIKTVDLFQGENFSPTYLRLNPSGTVPTLVVPFLETISDEVQTKYRALTKTEEIVDFLDKSRSASILQAKGHDTQASPAPVLSPATIDDKATSDRYIQLVHSKEADPNSLLLGARTSQELSKQKTGMQGSFCKNRFDALHKFRSEAQTSVSSTENPRTQQQKTALINWYDEKLSALSLLNDAYLHDNSAAVTSLTQATIAQWLAVSQVIATLETALETSKGPFLLGGQISICDLHVGAWLARVLAIAKGLYNGETGELDSLEKAIQWEGLGTQSKLSVGPLLRGYWKVLSERPSFQEVYGDGVH